MKAKNAIIGTVLAAAVAASAIYGAYRYSIAHRSPIEVMPVSTANLASWFYDDEDMEEDALDGTVFSKDMQTVELNNEYELTNVYVQEGDTVKVGDPLMEYDMTLVELKLEMEEITKQSLEITLSKQQKQLEKIKANPNSASVLTDEEGDDYEGDEGDDLTGSADTLEDSETVPASNDADEADEVVSDSDEADDAETVVVEDNNDLVEEEVAAEGEEDVSADDLLTDELIADESSNTEETTAESDASDTDEASTELIDGLQFETEDQQDLDPADVNISNITRFRILVNNLRMVYDDGLYSLSTDDIEDALKLYREELCDEPSEDAGTITVIDRDVFGLTRKVKLYTLRSDVIDSINNNQSFIDSNTTITQRSQLYRAYARVLFFDLYAQMEAINTALAEANVTVDTADAATILGMQEQIQNAVSAWYAFVCNWDMLEQLLINECGFTQEEVELLYERYFKDTLQTYAGVDLNLPNSTDGILSKLCARLNNLLTIETEAETETEAVTDSTASGLADEGDLGDADEGDDAESGLTQDEIEEMIREQELAISETELQIREQDIKIRQYERTMEGQVVKATMDGVVKTAGTVEGGGSDDGFIVITGSQGMYVRMSVNELKRDSIQIGDSVYGTSYENNATFEGVVTEISEYPSEDEDSGYSWYFGSDSDNTNASFYPVTAYIEEAGDLEEGYASVTIESTSDTEGGTIYLENYFVRTDSSGKAYVYKQGADGLLVKQYVKTGGSLWGSGIEIKSGLSSDDYIAFPYGSNVTEGAKTVQVDSIEDEE